MLTDHSASGDARRPLVWRPWIALVSITALGAVIRGWGLAHSLWVDELHTAWCISAGLNELPSRAIQGNYSPLFPLLVWLSQALFGLSEISVRLPSVMAGTALIPAAYFCLARMTLSKAAGLWAALLVALDGTCIYFSQEARASACVQLTVLVNYGLFFALVTGGASPGKLPVRYLRVLWVLTALATFYLHYTGVLALAGQPLWFALMRFVAPRGAENERHRPATEGGRLGYRLLNFLTDGAIVAFGCLPAAPHLVEIASHRDEFRQFLSAKSLEDTLTTFPALQYLAGPALSLLIVGVLIRRRGDGPAAGTEARQQRRRKQRQIQETSVAEAPKAHFKMSSGQRAFAVSTLLGCWYLVPLLIAGAAEMVFARYVIGAAVALPLLAGMIIGTRPYVTVQVLLAAAVVVPVQAQNSLFGNYRETGTFAGHFTEDWRSAVAWIRQHDPEAQHSVFLQPLLIEATRLLDPIQAKDARLQTYLLYPVTNRLYSLAEFDLTPLPNGDVVLHDPQIRKTIDRGGAWFVFRTEEPPQAALMPLLDAIRRHKHQPKLVDEQNLRGVVIVRVAVTK